MPTLTALAQQHVAPRSLTVDEQSLIHGVEHGIAVDIHGGTLPAQWIEWLLRDTDANAAVGAGGVHLQHATMTGPLDASHGRATFPLLFEHCTFDSPLTLAHTTLTLLSFEQCQTQTIDLHGATLDWLWFRKKSVCNGGITLTLARLERGLDFSQATLNAPGGIALCGNGLRSNGPLQFNTNTATADTPPFTAHGGITLRSAHVDGEVNLVGAHLHAGGTEALNANLCSIEDRVACSGARIEGLISLVDADIKGDLIADGAVLTKGRVYPDRPGPFVIVADRARVSGSVHLRKRFHADGQVRWYGATIGRDVECHEAAFLNTNYEAFSAAGATIDGSLQFANLDSRPPGECRIEGEVNLRRTTIKGSLIWNHVTVHTVSRLNLQSAKVHVLNDSKAHWPQQIDLRNFEYDAIAEESPSSAVDRLAWLGHNGRLYHQVYDHLARVLQQRGLYADAREVLYAKEKRHATEATLTLGDRWWYGYQPWIGPRIGFGPLAGYGYRLRASFVVMTLTVTACAALYWWGYPDLLAKASDRAPEFQSLAYSLDVFVPILDLAQGSSWIPDASKGRTLVPGPTGDLRTGGLLLVAYWLEVAIGWCVSSVLAGTITARLVKA
jgi:hypothetical protein